VQTTCVVHMLRAVLTQTAVIRAPAKMGMNSRMAPVQVDSATANALYFYLYIYYLSLATWPIEVTYANKLEIQIQYNTDRQKCIQTPRPHTYTVNQQTMAITLAVLDRFANFFQRSKDRYISNKTHSKLNIYLLNNRK